MAPDRTPAPMSLFRRRPLWLLPALAVLAWFAIGTIGGPYSGRLSQVQTNDAASFLPDSAESTRVTQLQRAFDTEQALPGFVVVESDRPLTDEQLARSREFAGSIPDLPIPVAGHQPVRVGDFLTGQPQVVPAEDGRALLVVLGFDTARTAGNLADGEGAVARSVQVVREREGELEATGLEVRVAGPAGQVADLVEAFSGIDGLLLGTALLAVLVILLLVYRSPVVPLLVILTSVLALALAGAAVYALADGEVLTLDGQAQGILSILVVGAATDYSLLLVARYKEELRRHDERYAAMRRAWRRTLEPVLASAGTVVLGLMCLLLSDMAQIRGLGPVGAIGILAAALAALTFLPGVLLLPGRLSSGEHGRWIFWPGVPHVGTAHRPSTGPWAAVPRLVGRHPRRVWTATALVLAAFAACLPLFRAEGTSQTEYFLTEVESVTGQEALARHFDAGSGDPTIVLGPAGDLARMLRIVEGTPGVASAGVTDRSGTVLPVTEGTDPLVVDGRVEIQATLDDPADSPRADGTVQGLRTALDAVGPDVLVGGSTAQNLDSRRTAAADRNRIIPVTLVTIFLVLVLLLRSLPAPLLVLGANVLSFGATIGASGLVFDHVLGFPGAEPSVPLYGFVFLVALGIDYSIFLMTRVREESFRQGTRPGTLAGLAVTGGVITSAGVVLAATFATLGVLPLLFLAQTAFIVAFGVLLDTLVVRSLLVPALTYDWGENVWWPRRPPVRAVPSGGTT